MLVHVLCKGIANTYLAKSLINHVRVGTSGNGGRFLHLGNGNGSSADDVGEASNDGGERSQAHNDERAVDDSNGLGRSLDSHALAGERLDVAGDLDSSKSRRDGRSKSQSGSEEIAERDHFDGSERVLV